MKKDTFEDYCDHLKYEYSLFNPNADISGGKLTIEEIDTIKDHPEFDTIKIAGLKQDTFEYFVRNYGNQFKAIYFWKNKSVKDLSILGTLKNIEFIGYFFNQGADNLWDMSNNLKLNGLSIDDFSKLKNINYITSAPNLEFLHFGNMIWDKLVIDSLKPISNSRLKYLHFSAKKIIDNNISPIATINSLKTLYFPSNLFTTEQLAWLTANVSDLESPCLCPFQTLDNPIEMNGSIKDILINGKGKPFLNSKVDKKQINMYVEEFENLVKKHSI